MANELKADNNTYVGYNFITKEFYVRNLDTKTAAKSAIEAKQILDIACPGNTVPLYNTDTETGIAGLPYRLETITNIYYTWEDTGKYIKNIYFNEYKTFAMQYDEPNLYIRGSVEMWDMSSSIDYETIAQYMQQYYTNYLGINVSWDLISAIIKYYKSIQAPYVYNIIHTRTDEEKEAETPLTYTNTLSVSNADKTARGEYNGIKNPDGEIDKGKYDVKSTGSTVKAKLYKVITINKGQGRIYLESASSDFSANDKIRLYGTNVEGLDGDYTVGSVSMTGTNPYIQIVSTESFPASFTNIYISDVLMKLDSSSNPVTETVSGNIITLTEAPVCSKGTIVQILGYKYQKNLSVNKIDKCYATSSADIMNNVVYVNETLNLGTNPDKKSTKPDEIDTFMYTNAYSISKCGYDNYTEIKSAQVIQQVVGANVYLENVLNSTDYVAGETVYIEKPDGTYSSYIVSSVTPSKTTVGATTWEPGYVTLTTAPTGIATHTVGSDPTYLQVRNTTKKTENSFTLDLTNSATMPLVTGDTFNVINAGTDIDGTYTVESISGAKVFIVRENGEEDLPEKDFEEKDRALLQIDTYSEKILLDMTYSRNASKMPMGSFMLDNDEQFTNYLNLYSIITPSSQNYANFDLALDKYYYIMTEIGYKATTEASTITLGTLHYNKVSDWTYSSASGGTWSYDESSVITTYSIDDFKEKIVEYTGTAVDNDIIRIVHNDTDVYMELVGVYSDVYGEDEE